MKNHARQDVLFYTVRFNSVGIVSFYSPWGVLPGYECPGEQRGPSFTRHKLASVALPVTQRWYHCVVDVVACLDGATTSLRSPVSGSSQPVLGGVLRPGEGVERPTDGAVHDPGALRRSHPTTAHVETGTLRHDGHPAWSGSVPTASIGGRVWAALTVHDVTAIVVRVLNRHGVGRLGEAIGRVDAAPLGVDGGGGNASVCRLRHAAHDSDPTVGGEGGPQTLAGAPAVAVRSVGGA